MERSRYRDHRGRLLPGIVPGWGLSWYLVDELGVSPEQFATVTPEERLVLLRRCWRAVGADWQPAVARPEWVGPHAPFTSPGIAEEAGEDPERVTAALDAIPSAFDRTREGIRQAARGDGVEVNQLGAVETYAAAHEQRRTPPPKNPWLGAISHAIEH